MSNRTKALAARTSPASDPHKKGHLSDSDIRGVTSLKSAGWDRMPGG